MAAPAPAGAATVGTGVCQQEVTQTTRVTVTQTGANCQLTIDENVNVGWTLPPGLSTIDFTIKGARGHLSTTYSAPFLGAVFDGTLQNLDGITELWFSTGEAGSNGSAGSASAGWPNGGRGGSNGAGGGGGATNIRTGTGTNYYTGLIVVAGGGGGLGGGNGQAGRDASGYYGGARGSVSTTCTTSSSSSGGNATSGRGGATTFRNAGGGGGGYGGGGAGGYTENPSFPCDSNGGGDGGRGSSYINPAYAVATGSTVGKWRTAAGVSLGTNSDYSMYTSTAGGQVVLTFPAKRIMVTAQPSTTAISGTAFATQPTVTVVDPSASVANVTVTASIGSSPGSQVSGRPTLGGTVTATTDANGVATFSDLSITGTAGAYTLEFSATGYGAVPSETVTLSGSSTADPAQVSIATAASTLTAASPAPTTTVTVQARDAGGNDITTGGATVTLTPSAGSIGTVTDVGNGTYTATFTAPASAGPVTISGAFNGSPITATATVTIQAAAASALAIGTQPAADGASTGQALGTQPVVRVIDAFGNTVTSSTAAITASVVTVSGATGTLGGTATQSATAGERAFTGLSITGTASSTYKLRFAATGLAAVESTAFSLARVPQTITFAQPTTPRTFGDAAVQVSASTTAPGLLISWAGTADVCTVTGDTAVTGGSTKATVAFIGAGTCTITASQAGNADIASATSVQRAIIVNKATQPALTISSATTTAFGSTLTLGTAGGAGTGFVTYALTTPGVCSLTSGVLSFSGAGSCAVQATKAADANYLSATSAVTTITVTPAEQTIAFTTAVPATPVVNDTYVVDATASSGLTPSLTLVQGAGTVCSISGATAPATITFIAIGTCEVRATQAGNANYVAATVQPSQVIEVGGTNQTITFAQPADVGLGAAPLALVATASSGLAVSFASSTTGVCTTTSGGLVTVLAVGTCTIAATQSGDGTYAAASEVARSFAVTAVTATAPTIVSASAGDGAITVSITAPAFTGGAAIVGYRLVATPASGPVVVSDSCTSVAAPISCTITGLENGSAYTITAAAINPVGVGDASAGRGPLTPAGAAMAVQDLRAVSGNTVVDLAWTPIANAALGGGTFTRYEIYQRASGSGWPGTPTATSTNQALAAWQATGLANGTSYDFKIVVITSANATEIAGATAIVAEYAATVPSAPRGLTALETSLTTATVSWQRPADDGGSAVTGYTVTITDGATNVPCGTVTVTAGTGAGTCDVSGLTAATTYSVSVVAANAVGSGAVATVSYRTGQAPQAALTISSATTAAFGSTITLATAGGSGTGTVSYALTTPGVCKLSSGVLSFTSAGSCVVQATKAADATYLAESSPLTTITVTRATQTLSFTSTVPAAPVPNGTYAVDATSSSGLPVSLALLAGDGTICTIDGGLAPATITFLAVGTCTVVASQFGSNAYQPPSAEPTQSIVVGAQNQTITFAQPADVPYGTAPFVLGATASSGLAVDYASSTTGVCTVAGDTVTIVAVGTCTITATQPGDVQYAAASPVPRSFAVQAVVPTAPTITAASAGDAQITLQLTAPASNGGAALTGFRLVATPSSGPAVTSDGCTDVTAPIACTILLPGNGIPYAVTAAAINSAGVGAASTATGLLTPVGEAGAVANLQATSGNESIELTWSPIANGDLGGGAFVRYEISQRVAGGNWALAHSSTDQSLSAWQATGLTNGTTYEFRVMVITTANGSEMSGRSSLASASAVGTPADPGAGGGGGTGGDPNGTTTPSVPIATGEADLRIRLRTSRTKLRVGQRLIVTLTATNRGTARSATTRACIRIPRGFVVRRTGGGRLIGRSVCLVIGPVAARTTRPVRTHVIILKATAVTRTRLSVRSGKSIVARSHTIRVTRVRATSPSAVTG